MAAGSIEILGSDVFCSIAGGGREARFPLTEARPKLADWAKRYEFLAGIKTGEEKHAAKEAAVAYA